MRCLPLSSLLPLLVLASCGGKVVLDAASGTTSGAGGSTAGGTGGAATTSISAGGAGIGGAGIGTTSATTSASVGAGGASPTCGAAFIDLVVGGVPVQLLSGCGDAPGTPSTVPGGVLLLAPGEVELGVGGCLIYAQNPSVRVGVSSGDGIQPGTYTGGTVSYTDGDGGAWMSIATGFQATIDQLGPVGGHIVGSFQATIAQGGVEQPLVGTFNVCRAPNVPVP